MSKHKFLEEYCFVHNGNFYLATIKVWEGGIIECWGNMTKEKFLKNTATGWITVDIPDGTELRIGDQGLIVNQAKTLRQDGSVMFNHKWITQEDFEKDVLDAYHVSMGHPSASSVCWDAYGLYTIKPTEENKEKLRKAYLDIPSHKRRYVLGDQDIKDGPIRRILGIL